MDYSYSEWMAEEVALLKELWGTIPNAEVAERVGHSERACSRMASMYGIKQRDKLLTVSSVAKLLFVHRNTVRRWIYSGLLTAKRSSVRTHYGTVWDIDYAGLMTFCKVYGYRPDLTDAFFSGQAHRHKGKGEEAA